VMRFWKYHALGNDYVILDSAEFALEPGDTMIPRICDRHRGVGADGILLGPLPGPAGHGLRIFNPDGSEAEKSGNGIRIFARFLRDRGVAPDLRGSYRISTAGGVVEARVREDGREATVAMGCASFRSEDIPVAGPPREVLGEAIEVLGRRFRFCAVTVGNPHCVVLCPDATRETACTYGPVIETDPRFPRRTNVQFLEVVDRRMIRIEIWERGAGYTLASGTSSCASAAASRRLGLCDEEIEVRMPGGSMQVSVGDGFEITLTGAVAKVAEGEIAEEALG
jgi:diaminopimelate epimerase